MLTGLAELLRRIVVARGRLRPQRGNATRGGAGPAETRVGGAQTESVVRVASHLADQPHQPHAQSESGDADAQRWTHGTPPLSYRPHRY